MGDRVELNTGNITTLPYDDGQFDLVVSSLAIHNLKAREDRRQAITEAVRVLEPGGKIIIADISHAEDYADWLTEAGMEAVTLHDLGVRGWWGGPWMPTSAVTAIARTFKRTASRFDCALERPGVEIGDHRLTATSSPSPIGSSEATRSWCP